MQIAPNIVSAFQRGEIDAFKAVYEQTSSSILALINRMTGRHHEAEDIMQDVYVRVYNKRDSYDEKKASLYTWIYRTAVNYTLNALRNKKRWTNDVVIEELAAEEVADKEDGLLARELLDKINPDFRVCLVLCDIEERPYQEIAEILKISIGTVRSRINRGRKELKELFNSNLWR